MSESGYRSWVIGIVIGDVLAIGLLAYIAHGADANTWANVIAVGLVGIASVDGIILQVLTAGRMTLIMDRQETEMTEQRKVLRDSISRTDTIIEQNKSLIGATQRQAHAAEKVLDHSKESLVISEQAYIGIKDIKLQKPLAVNEDPIITIRIVNGGRTPARNIIGQVQPLINSVDSPHTLMEGYNASPIAFQIPGQIGILSPNNTEKIPLELSGLVPKWERLFVKVIEETCPFYVVGAMRYKDFRNKNRIFRFIAFYNAGIGKCGGFIECLSRADDDESNENAANDQAGEQKAN